MKSTDKCTRRNFIKASTAAGISLMAAGPLFGCSSRTQEPEPAAEEPAAELIYIVDKITCKPGDGKALFDHYMKDYAEEATSQRGMTLVSSNVNPPLWLQDEVGTNTLEFTWSVEGMMGWAGMVGVARNGDPVVRDSIIDFWREIDSRCISRTRTLSAANTDVESLTTLAKLGA